MDHFAVELDQLRAHAGNLAELQDMTSTAQDAANQVEAQTLDLAYGSMCQAFPLTIHPIESKAIDLIQTVLDSLRREERNIRACADNYTEVDEHQKGIFNGLSKELG